MAQEKSGSFKLGEVNGVQVDKDFTYTYREFDSIDEVKSSADWTPSELLKLVNSHEKASAKANEYQKQAKPYMPDPSDPAQKRLTLIKNLVSMGVPKEIAEQQIDAILAASKA
jgi:hypothetical protein